MGVAVVETGGNPIRLVSADGEEIPCGGSLAHNATGMTFSWPLAAELEYFLVEATASAGAGGAWGIEGGSCGKTRAVDTVARAFTVPPGGTVAVRAAWAMDYGAVHVTPSCNYTVRCPPGYAGSACETSLCAAPHVPSAVAPTGSYHADHICVPEALQQHADVAHCSVEQSWPQITRERPNDRFTTGGLGALMELDEFEVWLCDMQAPCMLGAAEANTTVCYVFSERHHVFVPWGRYVDVLAAPAHAGTSSSGGNSPAPPPPAAVRSGDDVSFDFSNTVKEAHPGNGNEFKTLVYIELAGGLDGAAAFVNVKNAEEVHLW